MSQFKEESQALYEYFKKMANRNAVDFKSLDELRQSAHTWRTCFIMACCLAFFLLFAFFFMVSEGVALKQEIKELKQAKLVADGVRKAAGEVESTCVAWWFGKTNIAQVKERICK